MARLASVRSLDADFFLGNAGKNFKLVANSLAAKEFVGENIEPAAFAEVGNVAAGRPLLIKAAYIEAIVSRAIDSGLDVNFN
jgi:hypothetical protein